MSACELLPWKRSLSCLRQLTANPNDKQVLEASKELISICRKQQDNSLSQSACRKLVNELKVC
jgi:hypothetical protein